MGHYSSSMVTRMAKVVSKANGMWKLWIYWQTDAHFGIPEDTLLVYRYKKEV